MHGNAIPAHEADPAIDWLAEFEPEEPAPPRAPRPDVTPVPRPVPAPPAHDAPELMMYPAVEPESTVHASTRLIAKLPRLATVRPEDTLFRVIVPRRPATLDPIEAARFAPIEPDPLHRWSVRAIAIGVIVLVVLSTGVLAGGSALRHWNRLPAAAPGSLPAAAPAPPPVAAQAPPAVPAADSSSSAAADQRLRAAIDAPAPVRAAASARRKDTKPQPAARVTVPDRHANASKVDRSPAPVPAPAPASTPAPAVTDSRASTPPQAPPQLNAVASASISPAGTTPVTLENPPARTPAPVRDEPRPAAPAAPPPPRVTDSALIQSVVNRYEHAFSTLSLDGITTFWPSVNTRTLAKAFDQLQEQHVAFDTCRIDVHGDQADAVCGGQARFVTKIGSHTPRTERHQWAFTLLRQSQGWVIYKVDVR